MGYFFITLNLTNTIYNYVKVLVLDNLCVNIILDIDFQQQHTSMTLNFRRDKPDLNTCNSACNIEPPLFFKNLSDDCKPITLKSEYHLPKKIILFASLKAF